MYYSIESVTKIMMISDSPSSTSRGGASSRAYTAFIVAAIMYLSITTNINAAVTTATAANAEGISPVGVSLNATYYFHRGSAESSSLRGANLDVQRQLGAATLNALYIVPRTVPCIITKTYHSSNVENRWLNQIDHLADNTWKWEKGCARMRDDKKHVDDWMTAWKSWQDKRTSGNVSIDWLLLNGTSSDSLSYFVIEDDCNEGSKKQKTIVPIEPLMGFLRHPVSHCFVSKYYIDKNYIFIDHVEYIVPSLKMPGENQFPANGTRIPYMRYLFDLGASKYNSGAGGASQSWFVNSYLSFGIDFDRIFA